jgi:hypothetical protein
MHERLIDSDCDLGSRDVVALTPVRLQHLFNDIFCHDVPQKKLRGSSAYRISDVEAYDSFVQVAIKVAWN